MSGSRLSIPALPPERKVDRASTAIQLRAQAQISQHQGIFFFWRGGFKAALFDELLFIGSLVSFPKHTKKNPGGVGEVGKGKDIG